VIVTVGPVNGMRAEVTKSQSASLMGKHRNEYYAISGIYARVDTRTHPTYDREKLSIRHLPLATLWQGGGS